MKNRNHFLIAGLVAVALLGACGGSSSTYGKTETATDAVDTAQKAVDFNTADTEFAQMMIPHHEQAVEMSDIALDPTVGASDVVKSLATRIKAAQDPEITEMKGFLTLFGASSSMDHSMDSGDSGMGDGMLSAEDLRALPTLRGSEFDKAFMTGMIAHHVGAIDMAKKVISGGKNAAVRTLAEAIVSAQDIEITEMKKILG